MYARIRIGTQFSGEVDHLDSESIQTKFFVFILPLLPLSSHYVVSEQHNEISGYPIPLNAKSVAAAYLRMFAWLAWIICVVKYIFWIRSLHHGARSESLLPWVIGLFVFAMASTFWLGALGKRELLRRTMLRRIVGVGAPPALLPLAQRDATAAALVEQWRAAQGDQAWDIAIENGRADPLLFAIAEYHLRPELARRVLDQLRSGRGVDTSGGPVS